MTRWILYISLLPFITLIMLSAVCAVTPEEAKQAYELAGQKIEAMQSQGYPTLPLMDILSNAQSSYNNANYNHSITLSRQVMDEGDEIISLQERLIAITDQISLLSDYGADVTGIEIELLYAKSDFEAANINLAEKETDKISRDVIRISSNYSEMFYEDMKDYRDSLNNSNRTHDFFEEYYLNAEEYYNMKNYAMFFREYEDFEDIKGIIEMENKFYNLSSTLKSEGISLERASDELELVSFNIEQKEYAKALEIYSGLVDLASDAINIRSGLDEAKEYMERLNRSGILTDDAIDLYEDAVYEYRLENYQSAKENLGDLNEELEELERANLIFQSFSKAKIKRGLKDFFIENWLILSVMVLFVIFTHRFFTNSFLFYHKKRILSKNQFEIDTLTRLQKSLQKEYFLEKGLDKKDYESDFQDYEDRKIDLGNEISMSRLRLQDLEKYFERLNGKAQKIPLVKKVNLSMLKGKIDQVLLPEDNQQEIRTEDQDRKPTDKENKPKPDPEGKKR